MSRFARFFLSLTSLLIALPASLLAGEPELKPGQSFQMRISGVPADEIALVNQKYGISDEGSIRLPYLTGQLAAAGLKPSELARKIEAAYREAQIFTRPTIQVDVSGGEGSGERYVTVIGEVKASGSIIYQPGLTLVAAIAQSGGFTDFAKTGDIKVTRGDKVTYHNASDDKDNLQLQPGDIVTIRSGRRRN